MANGKWQMENPSLLVHKRGHCSLKPLVFCCPQGHVFGAPSPTTPSPLCRRKREFCSRLALVATVSAFCWPWALGCELPTTTANCAVIVATHTRDIKGEALGSLVNDQLRPLVRENHSRRCSIEPVASSSKRLCRRQGFPRFASWQWSLYIFCLTNPGKCRPDCHLRSSSSHRDLPPQTELRCEVQGCRCAATLGCRKSQSIQPQSD
jgi:hypothetical protein